MGNSTAEAKRRRALYMRNWRAKRKAARIHQEEANIAFWEVFDRRVRAAVRGEFSLCMAELRAELAAEAQTPSG